MLVNIENIQTPYYLKIEHSYSKDFLDSLPVNTRLTTLRFQGIEWNDELTQLLIELISKIHIEGLEIDMCDNFFVSDADAYDLIKILYFSDVFDVYIYLSDENNTWPDNDKLERYINKIYSENIIANHPVKQRQTEVRQDRPRRLFRLIG